MANYLATNTFPGTGAVMQIAISFAGNRPDNSSGTIPYFDAKDVKAEIVKPATSTTNEVVTPITLTQVNATTFKTSVIVPVGSNLRVYRETLVSYPMVDFADRQTVTENDLDTSSRQVLYAAMEALDKSTLAIEYARQGLTYAVTAVNTANAAATTAAGAVTTANGAAAVASSASAAASSAVTTANTASAAAAQAAKDAAAAETHATNVETLAAQAQAASAAATTTANNAKTTAEGIDAKATSALQNSSTAVSTANAAKTTAEGIDGKAQSAINTANDAASKAASAKATAEGIDAKATSAQETANAAQQQANTAAGNASQALTTANGLSAKIDQASGDASAAGLSAKAANDNANTRVAKSGDTMTGTLTLPKVIVGSYQIDGNGFSRKEAGSGVYQLSGEAAYLTNFSYLYMTPKDNGNAHWWVKGPNDADRGLIYNDNQGNWTVRTASQQVYVMRNNGVFDVPGRAFGGGKEFIRRGQTYMADSNNVTTFASNASNFGTDPGTEPLRISDGGNAAAAAMIAFLREGNFGAYFGLDNDNQWAVGGWSMGKRRFKLWHEGNFNPGDYVSNGAFPDRLVDRGWPGNVGSWAMCQTVDGNNRNPGDTIGAGGLRWASHNAVLGSGPGSGTWRCCGWGNNGGVTLWQRIS